MYGKTFNKLNVKGKHLNIIKAHSYHNGEWLKALIL